MTQDSQKSYVVIINSCYLITDFTHADSFPPDAYWEKQKTNRQTVFRNAVTVVTLFPSFALHALLWLRLLRKLEQS